MELVTSTRLAEKLQVKPETLFEWRHSGILTPADTINGVNHYTIKSIDEFLRRKPAKMPRIISAIDVINGRVRLLTTRQAGERLGTSGPAVNHRIERGNYPAVRVGGEWRLVESDVDKILARVDNPDYIPRPVAAHIFGSSIDYLKERVRDGELRAVTISKKPITTSITRESILCLIRKIAPPWVNPEAWVAEREEDDRPLMVTAEFERLLGLPIKTGGKVLRSERVAYLQITRSLVKISPVSAYQLFTRPAKLTNAQLAAIFGENEATIRNAWQSGIFRCQLHPHLGSELRRGCVMEMLRACLSPGVAYETRWYEGRLKKPEPLLSIPEAAIYFKIPEEEVIRRIQNGKLRAVKLPGPHAEWRISKTAN